MNRIKFFSLVSTILLGLALPTWAGPRGGGGGFHGGGFAGGGRSGGGSHSGGGSRAAPAFNGGGFRGAPVTRGAYFTGRSIGRPTAGPRFYYGGNRMSAVRPQGFTRSVVRSTRPYIARSAAATRTKPRKFNCRAKPRYRSADFDRNKSSIKSRTLSCRPESDFKSTDLDSS